MHVTEPCMAATELGPRECRPPNSMAVGTAQHASGNKCLTVVSQHGLLSKSRSAAAMVAADRPR